MTALSALRAGSRLTAAEVQGVAPLAAYKGADQGVTSSTTLVNDTALLLPVAANATYKFELEVLYTGGTSNTSDLKIGWTVPAGTTMIYTLTGVALALGVVIATGTQATTVAVGSNGAANILGGRISGTIATSSTAGNLQMTWAQNTSNATATTVKLGSSLLAWQIA